MGLGTDFNTAVFYHVFYMTEFIPNLYLVYNTWVQHRNYQGSLNSHVGRSLSDLNGPF